MHREELSGPSIELLQVRAPPMNDAKTLCRALLLLCRAQPDQSGL